MDIDCKEVKKKKTKLLYVCMYVCIYVFVCVQFRMQYLEILHIIQLKSAHLQRLSPTPYAIQKVMKGPQSFRRAWII